MENYLICVIALHKLMQVEQSLIKGIIASAHQPRVFELIVREAMDTIVQDGEVSMTDVDYWTDKINSFGRISCHVLKNA
jgi:hypothetical protein